MVQGFRKPTAVQSCAVPALLSGRDVIAIAHTGTGKTGAFVWPLCLHAIAQREVEKGEGPIGLILAPTRELVTQIHTQLKTYAKPFGMKAAGAILG